MELDATTQLILAVAGLIGLVTFGGRWMLRYVSRANAKLEAELRADIAEKATGWKKACQELATAQRDIAALKSSAIEKDAEIKKLKLQIDVLTKAIDTMHANYESERTKRENGETRNEELKSMLTERDKLNKELFETTQQQAHEIEILRSLLTEELKQASQLKQKENKTDA